MFTASQRHYRLSRRNFIWSVGASAGLVGFLRSQEALQAGLGAPKRFMVIQHSVGTIADQYWPAAPGPDFEFSRILSPFEPLRNQMVVLGGLQLPTDGGTGGGHERGTVALMTGKRTVGLYPGNGGDDCYAEGPSVDQRFVQESRLLRGAAVGSLQVTCDARADTAEISTRHLSYAAARTPMAPFVQAADAYAYVFGSSLLPGGNSGALERARQQKHSVLDFVSAELQRLRTLVPVASREILDSHEDAIRDLERRLDEVAIDPSCALAAPPQVELNTLLDSYRTDHIVEYRDDLNHERLGSLHLAVIKAAFKCDLTRVVTFQWSPGGNHVSFGGLWPPDESVNKVHHTSSHDAESEDLTEFLARVEIWYNERTSAFLQELAAETDLDGSSSLLDNTVVPYVTEVADRHNNWSNMPLTLFGGANVGLITNQYLQATGTTNDMWSAIAPVYGLDGFTIGEEDLRTEPVEGLFV